MQATWSRPKIVAAADGWGFVGYTGARLLADLADATGLTAGFSDALAGLRMRMRQTQSGDREERHPPAGLLAQPGHHGHPAPRPAGPTGPTPEDPAVIIASSWRSSPRVETRRRG